MDAEEYYTFMVAALFLFGPFLALILLVVSTRNQNSHTDGIISDVEMKRCQEYARMCYYNLLFRVS